MNSASSRLVMGLLGAVVFGAGCDDDTDTVLFPDVEVPAGFRVERVVGGLNFPTSITWDDQGRMYVSEAGAGLIPEQLAPIRILRVDNGRTTQIANLDATGVSLALVGMVWHNGAFFITHRAKDRTGTVSRVTLNGQVTQILTGIQASQAEHQVNGIVVGPDGRMYIGSGQAGNSAVMGPDVAGPLMLAPNARAVPCRDIVLTGRNFKGPDFRTPQMGDSVLTGAFVTFGTATTPGQVVRGSNKCGGSVLAFDPNNAEGTVRPFASGMRQPIGIAFNRQTREMFVAENGLDIRGLRPVKDEIDATMRVQEGAWLGFPDYSAGREPLTNPKFEPPDSLQAEVFVNGQSQGKSLGFVINHAASGLTPPDPTVVVGRHEWNSSPALLDVAPASWGEFAGHLFVAEWGDLRPQTNPLSTVPVGQRIVRINPATRQLTPFVGRRVAQLAAGQGIERPFDVKFGPDGAMYIVDFGVVRVRPGQMPPFEQVPGTGTVWRVVRTAR